MTAAAARKKQTVPQPNEAAAVESTERRIGLWLDKSLLTTTLSKKGSPKDASSTPLPTHMRAQNRILGLADMVLGNPKGAPVIDQRKKDRKLKKAQRS